VIMTEQVGYLRGYSLWINGRLAGRWSAPGDVGLVLQVIGPALLELGVR